MHNTMKVLLSNSSEEEFNHMTKDDIISSNEENKRGDRI